MPPRLCRWRDTLDPSAAHPLLGALVGVALVVVLVPLLDVWRGSDPTGPLYLSIPLFFLVPVLLASVAGGWRAGVLVAIVAIVVWDWFFIQPLYTVTVASPRDLLALLVFLVVALLVGQLANLTRRRTEEALQRARSSDALYDLSLALIARQDSADVLAPLTARLRSTFDLVACAVLLPATSTSAWHIAAVAGDIPLDLSVTQSRNVAATVSWVQASGSGRLGWANGGHGLAHRSCRSPPRPPGARPVPPPPRQRPAGRRARTRASGRSRT